MKSNEEREDGVEFLLRGGAGSEASIDVELRTKFPGIGGTIETYQALAVAARRDYQEIGHRMFLRHAIIKKLEDYFFKKGTYGYAHVTRPLGSTSSSYIYEWAFGHDAFPWSYRDDAGNIVPVQLDDWSRFMAAFSEVGIDFQRDCTDPDNADISQNIVHQLHIGTSALQPSLNRLWKRIDFGPRSITMDYSKILDYLENSQRDIRETLRIGRFELISLACRYLNDESGIDEKDIGKLEMLILDYRLSTLEHLNTRGVGPEVRYAIRLEPRATRGALR